MGKHTAWRTFQSTRNPAPPPEPKVITLSMRNFDQWVNGECAVCDGEFDTGMKVILNSGLMVHVWCG